MDANLVITQLTAAAGCSYILQLLQGWERLPWVTAHTRVINHIIRVIMSGAAVLGISSAWAPSTTGGHTLTITIPAVTVILHGLWTWFGQFVMTHGWSQLLAVGTVPVPPKQP